ncbi:cupredoxin domain-containing protein [Denitratisoma oestradiolicum]|uniref:Plastocyanin n=1 Tax=Denitratisoma oestradiolicum TaxID=311182 RepID=A0A6S6XPD1_9PROT|nr:plastocyanin/azurin family copper-binding protein [Denitratisoma oestradiolicum]TWO81144.1 hypothetical protein CBW56_05935 [Denitratisoma oestradiolicum]CAB1367831.1 Plastocyanin [Denitratisoma oestradiolicum]
MLKPFYLALALATASLRVLAAEVEIGIADYRFDHPIVKIAPGDTVRWVNKEKRTSHSVFFFAESLESERLFPGETWSRRFDVPGIYPYRCGPHPEMQGEVMVAPVESSEQAQPAQ